jgi:CheY-like chemotaxis protein
VLNLDELKMLLHGYQDVEPLPTLEIPAAQTPEFGRYLTDKRILIADDIPAYRDLVVKKLKNRGFKHIYIANNGLEAVSLSQEYEIDVVFMDHMMPVMNGEEACKAIKAQRPETLVIGFSAVITPALEADLSQSLMDKVYMKDFKQFELVFEFMQSYFSQGKNHD